VVFPDAGTIAPVRVRVTVSDRVVVERGKVRRGADVSATAEAELAPPVAYAQPAAFGDEYGGPFAERQGKRMRPDVAAAFDRMAAAARAAGVDLLIDSAAPALQPSSRAAANASRDPRFSMLSQRLGARW
jgi:hypothetical protein